MSQQALADRLFIDRSYFNRLLKGKKEPSERLMYQVTLLEQLGVDGVHHPQRSEEREIMIEESGKMSQPSRQQCEDYFANYLDEVEKISGGIGHTWVQLQMYFSSTSLKRLQQKDDT